jgi:nucleoid-associated protein YgaU
MTVIGGPEVVSEEQLAQLRAGGAEIVQRIPGDPQTVQASLDQLVEQGVRFLPDGPGGNGPESDGWRTYTIQPGDTLSSVAKQMYGEAHLWRIIFEANRDILDDPGQIHPGQELKIPPKPE